MFYSLEQVIQKLTQAFILFFETEYEEFFRRMNIEESDPFKEG